MATSTTALAVVTGASSGIGRELALQFAAHGFDLVVTAEDAELDTTVDLLRDRGAHVAAIRTDLSRPEGVEELAERLAGTHRPVAAAAINAGVGTGGTFAVGTALQDHLTEIDLNVRSTVHLAYRLVPGMRDARRGRLLFTSAVAATAPGPFQSVYSASKAFIESFAQALREELRDTGVSVTALLPGPTDTEFFARANMLDTKIGSGPKDNPADVAKQGYDALMTGRDHVIAGAFSNRVQATVAATLPETTAAHQHRRLSEPGTGNAPE